MESLLESVWKKRPRKGTAAASTIPPARNAGLIEALALVLPSRDTHQLQPLESTSAKDMHIRKPSLGLGNRTVAQRVGKQNKIRDMSTMDTVHGEMADTHGIPGATVIMPPWSCSMSIPSG